MLLRERPETHVVNVDALTYAGNLANLEDVADDPRYEFVQEDIGHTHVMRDVLRDADAVVNAAAESHVDRSIQSAAPFLNTNVAGTVALMEAALTCGVPRFVQVSTDEVYGELAWRDPESGPPGEDRFREDTPLAPRSPYAASKTAGDLFALAFHHTHRLPVLITRCSNNYGSHQFPEKLIPLAVTNLLDGHPVPVYGDGLNVRDWIHVEDHCRGILAALDRGLPGEIYHFGADEERTNLSLLHEILALVGEPDGRLEFVEDRPGHDRRYAIEWRKSRRELGWRPERPMAEGLEATVHWYRDHRDWWEPIKSGAHGPARAGGPTSPGSGIELAPGQPRRTGRSPASGAGSHPDTGVS